MEKGPITTPVWLTGLWMALFIIRPWEQLVPELKSIYFERVFALTVLGVVAGSGLFQFRGCRQTYSVLMFFIALAISSVFAYNTPLAWEQLYKYLTLIIFYLVLLSVIRTPHQLEFIITCYIVTMAFYLGKAEWEYFVYGKHQWQMGVPRLIGIEYTFGGPNSVASATVVSLPFLQFLWWYRHDIPSSWTPTARKWFPHFLLGYFALALSAIILTNSRSGAVGFVVFILLFARTQRQPKKKFKRVLIAIFLLAAVWTFMPETTKGRITTLWNPEAGPRSAKGSADGRKESFFAGLTMFSREPVTGVGLGNTALYRMNLVDGEPISPHNLYGEVLGETGLIGATTFAFLISSILANVRATKSLAKGQEDPTITMLSDLARTCSYVVVLLLISGLAGAGMVRFQWLWLGAFALLARTFSESIYREEMEYSDLDEPIAEPTSSQIPFEYPS